MAYYLSIDAQGDGNWVQFDTPVSLPGDFTITMDISMVTNGGTGGAAVLLAGASGNANFVAIYGNPGIFMQIDGGGFVNFGQPENGYWPGPGRRMDVVIQRTSGVITLQVDDEPIRTLDGGAIINDTFEVERLGLAGTEFRAVFDLYGLSIEASGVSHSWDPSASNGTGLILPDTIGGNDADLRVYVDDDSQWVEYDGIPTNLSFTELSETSVRLTWDVTSVDRDYDLEWRILNDAGNETFVGDLTTEQYDLTGLTAGVEYEFRVRETDGVTDYDWTAWSSFEIAVAVSPVLSSLVEVSVGETVAEFTVSANKTGTLYYLVDTSPTADEASIEAGSSQAITVSGTQTINLTGLTDNTSYYLHVFFEDDDLAASNILDSAQFTTDEIIVPAGAPTSSVIFSADISGSWNGSAFVGSEDLIVPAGTNHLLIFLTRLPSVNAAFTFELDGEPITLDETTSDTNSNGVHLFSIPTPTTGTLSFSYNFSSSNPTFDLFVVGISGTSGIRGSILTAGGYTFGSRTANITTDVDDLVVDCFVGTGLASFSPAAEQTLLSSTTDRGSSERVATGASTDMTWTHPDSWTAINVISFMPAAAVGELPTPINLSVTDLTSESATLNWEQGV